MRQTGMRLVLLPWLCLLAAGLARADERGRPQPAIASAHPMATAAGHEMLAAGGNAFDAAVAVGTALAVVEPFGSGLGGGGLFLLYEADAQRYVMVDGRETAPGAATRDMYLDDRGQPVPNASLEGPLAAAIPGLPAALVHLARRYGRLPLQRLLAPAIRYARDGVPADERLLQGLRNKRALIAATPASAAVFMPGGSLPQPGQLILQPDLAATLESIARDGAESFYRGELARTLVRGVRAGGGIWSLDDLAAYRVVEREPLVGNYRDLRIVSAAPPSSGGIVLIDALNILSAYELRGYPRALQRHLVVEAMRRAYRDRAEYLGDPDFVDVPLARLTHPYYAAGQRTSIRLDRATPSDTLPGARATGGAGMQTTHYSVLDGDGNRVAATQTINTWFGSGFIVAGTGLLLNNEMDDFSVKAGVPNAYALVGAEANSIAPGKRPLSSMTPTFLESGRGVAILGTPGGARIISMVLLAALEFDAGGSAEELVSLRRYHHQYLPDEIYYEAGALSAQVIAGLRELGHRLREADEPYGNMHAIVWEYGGTVEAASDPRGLGDARVQVR